ncbi:N-acetylmuramoyl-L-alanine amidase [Virgibacillus proomii]|uniref:N-acetylmuramoyl-L-alanine amidase n=1 Tax=Virgibacillus proomii TaxID=84407 RepID=UPI001C105613|nr:N-acetylmuramoyl-L-alanine amidase [Virgibacillus proomii]MBU5267695.1 N-acetylmuramoyl-L-alanine amidase [Virgibacillus proomii]
MALRIKRQLAPQRAITTRTSGGGNPKRYITIHQTGNTTPGADAQAHANIQSRVNPRQASWHWQVDDKIAIQSFEDNIKCWHAGDGNGPGNTQSIGIEICINSDGDYRKAVENGAELARILLDKYGLGVEDLRQHHDWSRKNCPAQIRANKDGISWSDFKRMVSGEQAEAKPSKPPKPSVNKSISRMADEVIAGKHGNGNEVRRKSLGISKSMYEKVRDEVNQRAGIKNVSKPKPRQKSIAKMAQEVIDGKHGNGHEERRKSLGIGKARYAKVRNEVNRRLSGGGGGASKSASKPKPKTFKVGQKVTVKKSANKFATGQPIASHVKGNTYRIKQVKSDRVLLDGIMSWVRKEDVY